MKNNTIITTLSFIVIMFFASCGNKTSESKTEKTATEQTENTRYQCPMKCEGEKRMTNPVNAPFAIWTWKK
ncbi:MAG: hypothetical protein IPL25_14515 [Saprospiraceae bacterium]|nr:hypothetical protein [Candidatus Vicinibacter affinis]